jgi:Kef-type K+ transport system membrane component KefB
MAVKRLALIYVAFLVVFGSGIWSLLVYGPANTPAANQAAEQVQTVPVSFASWVAAALHQPLILLLMQIVVIIGFTRLIGNLFRPLGQPRVVVEIAAGIVLGPSVLGLVWPEAGAFLFPPSSLPALGTLSQIGLILFMFAVGMHLEPGGARQRATTAILISHGTMLLAFLIGVASAWWLYPTYAGAAIGFVPFALFMGIALSVTAFPVLARILKERQLTSTPSGALALTCAASDDMTAWCLLAVVMAIAKSGPLTGAAATIGFTVVYVVVMLAVVRPLLARLLHHLLARGDERTWMAMVLLMVLLSAMITEIIGIHALFGAFFAGVVMPKDAALRTRASERVEYVSELVLLPLFFALTGLRTQIGLLDQGHLWLTCVGIIALAVSGKLLGGACITRLVSGFGWRDSWLVGALLNTRGLMELVVLNIGYELGILSPTIFTMLVLMALLTTVMTGPLIGLLTGRTRLDTVTLRASEPAAKTGNS